MTASPEAPRAVGVVGAGHMGAAVAADLAGAGFEVWTALDGRSERSRTRAEAAGVRDAGSVAGLLTRVDTFLSVVPADAAEPLAAEVAGALGGRALHYVDANSITPARTRRVAQTVRAAGAVFSDGGIIGAPPGEGKAPARLYVSGPHAGVLTALGTERMLVRPLGEGETQATEMKILFAAANKGAVALLANVLAGAERAGLVDEVRAELDAIRPGLLAGLIGHAGELPDKAARWAVEMDDLADGLAGLGVQSGYHRAAGEGYRGLARALANGDGDADPLLRVLRAWCAEGEGG